MKLFLILILLFPSLAFGARKPVNAILKCLGEEEKQLHKHHSTGPLYNLNQKLIASLIRANDVPVKSFYVKQICDNKVFAPSVAMLKLLVVEGNKIFLLPPDNNTVTHLFFEKRAIQDLVDEGPELLLNYFASLQAITANATCLTEEIPEYNKLLEKMRYLEGEISYKALLHQDNLTEKIFKALSKFDQYVQRCKEREVVRDKIKMEQLEKREAARVLPETAAPPDGKIPARKSLFGDLNKAPDDNSVPGGDSSSSPSGDDSNEEEAPDFF